MAITADEVVATYVKLRDKRSELKKAFTERDEQLKAQQNKLEIWLLNKLTEVGADSFKTEHGTAYRTTTLKASPADFDLAFNWAAENGTPDLFEKRISNTFVKEYMKNHNDAIPPGVNIFQEATVNIRRS